MVEHAAHNRGVAGSIPATATTLIPPGAHVLAAVSGGSDSTALLLALHGSGVRVTAAHYDHALRPGSEADARHVAELCGSLGVPLIAERRTQAPARGSRQAAARRLRYEFLDRVRGRAGAELVALGHTADDVVEGVVLHLLRGCGLAGMRGMPARRGYWVRPLLGAWRADLRAALRASGIGWLEDPSNQDARYARSRVRHELLPRLERDRPGLTLRLRAAAARAAELHGRLQDEATTLHRGPTADLQVLAQASSAVRREALRLAYVAAGGFDPGLSGKHLFDMERLALARRTGASLDLPGRLIYRVGAAAVDVSRDTELRSTMFGKVAVESGHQIPGEQLPS